MTRRQLILKGIEYTKSRYNDGFGWQVFTECWDVADWESVFEEDGFHIPPTTWEELKEYLDGLAEIWQDRHDIGEF